MSTWDDVFPEGPLKQAARQFVASIQAHALFELGFEDHINNYEARDLALVATQICGPMTIPLRNAAKDRAEGRDKELLEELL